MTAGKFIAFPAVGVTVAVGTVCRICLTAVSHVARRRVLPLRLRPYSFVERVFRNSYPR